MKFYLHVVLAIVSGLFNWIPLARGQVLSTVTRPDETNIKDPQIPAQATYPEPKSKRGFIPIRSTPDWLLDNGNRLTQRGDSTNDTNCPGPDTCYECGKGCCSDTPYPFTSYSSGIGTYCTADYPTFTVTTASTTFKNQFTRWEDVSTTTTSTSVLPFASTTIVTITASANTKSNAKRQKAIRHMNVEVTAAPIPGGLRIDELLPRQDANIRDGRNRTTWESYSWWEVTSYTTTITSWLSSNTASATSTVISTVTTTAHDLRLASGSNGPPLHLSVDPSNTAPVWTDTVTVIPNAGASSGLTGAQKAGIAVGVIGGVAVLLGAFAFLFFARRRQAEDSRLRKQGGAIQVAGGQPYHPGTLENIGWAEEDEQVEKDAVYGDSHTPSPPYTAVEAPGSPIPLQAPSTTSPNIAEFPSQIRFSENLSMPY